MDVTLPDGVVIQGVPEGTTKEQLLGKLMQAKHPSAQALMTKMATSQTLGEMGGMEKFNAGIGSAFSNIKNAGLQMVGADNDYKQNKEQQRALLNTGAGLGGNVAGNIAAFAPLALVPGAASIAGSGAIGATAGGLQPTDTTGERLANMGVGGLLGAGVQAISRYPAEIWDAAKGIGRGLKATVEPFYEGGRQQILGRALRDASGGNPDVTARLSSAKELIPGSTPTAAEVAGSPGIAAMQRTASATNPEAYSTRALQQNEARVAALQDLAGTSGARASAESARDTVAKSLYGNARAVGVDEGMAKALKPQIDNLMERMPNGVLEKAKELARLNGETLDKAGSVNGLHWVKLAVDDALSGAKQTGMGKQTSRALMQFKNDLLSVVDELSPAYASARTSYAQASRPIAQMDIAQELADRGINKLTGQLQPQAYARALSDDMAAKATGFNKATLANTLEPRQLATMNALKEDLARSVSARDLGRGPGSDTVQKLAMSNLMQRSGLPSSVLHFPVLGRAGSWAYDVAERRMQQQLAEALLNPQEAGKILSRAGPVQLPAQTNPALGNRAAMLARALTLPAIATSDQR